MSPDVILTHNGKDAHQDHRHIAELTWNTFRDHVILEYEIPKYDGDMGRPNVFVQLDAEASKKKVTYLMETFQSQRSKRWFRGARFSPSCVCVGWSVTRPAAMRRRFIAGKRCSGHPGKVQSQSCSCQQTLITQDEDSCGRPRLCRIAAGNPVCACECHAPWARHRCREGGFGQ